MFCFAKPFLFWNNYKVAKIVPRVPWTFTHLLLMVTTSITVVQYQNQEIDIGRILLDYRLYSVFLFLHDIFPLPVSLPLPLPPSPSPVSFSPSPVCVWSSVWLDPMYRFMSLPPQSRHRIMKEFPHATSYSYSCPLATTNLSFMSGLLSFWEC